MLLLVAPNERKVWIATGYGAGGFLTDAMSGRHHPRGDPPALQAEPARLRRRDRGRRRRHHQADEPAARGSAEECRGRPASAAAAPAFRRQSRCPSSSGCSSSASSSCRISAAAAVGAIASPARRDQPVGGAVGPERTQPRFARRLGRRIVWGGGGGGWGGGGGFSGGGGSFGGGGASRIMVMQLTDADRDKVSRRDRRGGSDQQWRDRRGRDADQRSLSRCRRCTGRWSRCSRCLPGRRGDRPRSIWWYDFLFGGWQPEPTLSQLLTLLMVFAALKFTVASADPQMDAASAGADPGCHQASPRSPPRGRDLQGRGRAPHDGPHRHPDLSVDGRAAGRDRRPTRRSPR